MRAAMEDDYGDYVRARLPRLRRAAYLMCGDVHRADDIVQATLIRLYRKWGQATASQHLDAYVHRMLLRRFLDEERLGWARVLMPGRDALDRPVDSGRDDADRRVDVVTALRRLPAGQRAVVVLRFMCDMSIEAAAEVLGCSTGNVKAQTSRALAALRPILGHYGQYSEISQRGASA
jgi:RNA polymerase sigma-70 factor (sigma-E family)